MLPARKPSPTIRCMKLTLAQFWNAGKKPLRISAAILLILLGLLGLIFPIMPGLMFLIPGVTLLAPNNRLARWVRRKARQVGDRRRGPA